MLSLEISSDVSADTCRIHSSLPRHTVAEMELVSSLVAGYSQHPKTRVIVALDILLLSAILLDYIPMTPIWQGVVVIALITSCLFIWRSGLEIVWGILSTGGWAAYWMLALAGIVCAVAGTRIRGLEYAGMCLVVPSKNPFSGRTVSIPAAAFTNIVLDASSSRTE